MEEIDIGEMKNRDGNVHERPSVIVLNRNAIDRRKPDGFGSLTEDDSKIKQLTADACNTEPTTQPAHFDCAPTYLAT